MIRRETKEKIISLFSDRPGLGGTLLLLPEECDYYLISRESLLSVEFSFAAVLDGEAVFLSNEDDRAEMERFLTQN